MLEHGIKHHRNFMTHIILRHSVEQQYLITLPSKQLHSKPPPVNLCIQQIQWFIVHKLVRPTLRKIGVLNTTTNCLHHIYPSTCSSHIQTIKSKWCFRYVQQITKYWQLDYCGQSCWTNMIGSQPLQCNINPVWYKHDKGLWMGRNA